MSSDTPKRRATVADAFTIHSTPEAEELFQKQLAAEEAGKEPCYFCGFWNHRLTECANRP